MSIHEVGGANFYSDFCALFSGGDGVVVNPKCSFGFTKCGENGIIIGEVGAASYTQLDVKKRQV